MVATCVKGAGPGTSVSTSGFDGFSEASARLKEQVGPESVPEPVGEGIEISMSQLASVGFLTMTDPKMGPVAGGPRNIECKVVGTTRFVILPAVGSCSYSVQADEPPRGTYPVAVLTRPVGITYEFASEVPHCTALVAYPAPTVSASLQLYALVPMNADPLLAPSTNWEAVVEKAGPVCEAEYPSMQSPGKNEKGQ